MLRGYVLHTRPFTDSSVLVNMLIDGLGRVDCVARLGSGKTSIKSILQPFQPLIFELSGRTSLKNLIQIEAGSPAVPISGEVSFAGFYLNELLVRCISVDHGAEQLFFVYHKTLMAMAGGFCQSQLRYFELSLLKEIGLMPTLSVDISQDAIEPDYYYRLLPDQGFVSALGPKTSHYSGEMLLSLESHTLHAAHFKQAKHLMRLLLAPCLGDKPLKSRALFKHKAKSQHAK
ncbi:DNA repair protein RecO [Shewanella hanedai]|jgi:DNA repair protein RecO (recombination protein O)|uniref:DNA repair protein RecO n=1 Tax=Shewanella hanedai TaxID=25 RepID=A0A553JHJ2_SHEHA|nr:DNA repair protein RecO [Shewanella hanedai]TRY11923.1 DNA repair protein RecO [Shewanella hanedai]GGJ01490.1 DNA repair protein RecO [Shewanella hanedai]